MRDRLPAMSLPCPRRAALAAAIALTFALAACTATGSSGSAGAASPATPAPSATASSGNPGGPIATSPVNPGSGGPGGVNPGGPVANPSPSFVSPVSGLANVHDVHASEVTAHAIGSHIVATVAWWSGPPPCTALAEVAVARNGDAFTLTVREGAQQLGVACPALAMYKATTVDLGSVLPGTYTVAASGAKTAVSVVVTG